MSWELKGGTGRWAEHVNSETGESSIKQHELRVVKTWCADKRHDYVVDDIPKRIARCLLCGKQKTFIVGRDEIKDNKVIFH